METSNCDLVVSICEQTLNLSKFSFLSKDGALSPYAEITSNDEYIRRQNLPVTYAENGAIYLQRVHSLRNPPLHTPNNGSFRSDFAKGYVMSRESSLDIDTPLDLHLARLLMSEPFDES